MLDEVEGHRVGAMTCRPKRRSLGSGTIIHSSVAVLLSKPFYSFIFCCVAIE